MKPYSIRNKSQGDLIYDVFPEKVKNQIIYIWFKFFNVKNNISKESSNAFFSFVEDKILEFHGIKELVSPALPGFGLSSSGRVTEYFESLEDVESILDVIEFVFNIIERRERASNAPVSYYSYKKAVEDLNDRLAENDLGYRLQNGKVIRVDKELLHSKIVDKTFNLLSNPAFVNANEEFLNAHLHYRNRRYKECLTDCLNAFETTMKIICTEKGWIYKKDSDTASRLIKICIENELIPKYLTNSLTGIRTTLESTIPTIRNKNSGHGQGVDKKVIPRELASYMLYVTGATINFFVTSAGGEK